MTTTRSVTVTFQISLEQRALLDAQGRPLRVTNSEYGRRIIVGAAPVDARARSAERETERAEITSELASLRAQLAETQSSVDERWRETLRLHGELTQWSDDLVAAAKDLLAGDGSAQVMLATIWSRLTYTQRLNLLPIVAALVSSSLEQVAGSPPINKETTHIAVDFLERVVWLIEALDCDAGDYSLRTKRDGPLEQVFRRIAKETAQRLELLSPDSGEAKVAGQTAVDDGGFEWV
jgi:hypothetical protein